jgi:Protein of unknown function (DUF642)/PEP-CTERM motif
VKKLLLLVSALGVSTSASAANSVINGGFEAPSIADPCCITSPSVPIPGWTVTPNVNIVNGTFSSTAGNLAFEGNQYLDLIGEGGTGGISQSIATILGQVYYVSFAYSHNLFGSAIASASASYSIGGLNGTISHSTGSTSNLDWRQFSGSFVGTGAPTVVSFTNLTGGRNEGVLLDAINVSAVPEPATWAQLLLGFAVLGGVLRFARRAKGVALSAA